MRKYWLGVVLFFTAFNASAALPAWTKSAAKGAALDQFIDWMRNGPYYTLTDTETSEIKLESGQEGVRVRILFDDSNGCKDRFLNADCLPQNDTMACFYSMSECN